jgi:hypothetical protein
MRVSQIEKRLTLLESKVARLKSASPPKNLWWNKIAGVFADDPLFAQAMRHDRAAREPLRPPSRAAKNGRSNNRPPSIIKVSITRTVFAKGCP